MLAQTIAFASIGLAATWAFTTSKKRGYSTVISMLWGMVFILLLLSRHPIIMIGGFLMFTIVSIKHQLQGLKNSTPVPKQLCSKCGHESQGLSTCPNCNNHLSVAS